MVSKHRNFVADWKHHLETATKLQCLNCLKVFKLIFNSPPFSKRPSIVVSSYARKTWALPPFIDASGRPVRSSKRPWYESINPLIAVFNVQVFFDFDTNLTKSLLYTSRPALFSCKSSFEGAPTTNSYNTLQSLAGKFKPLTMIMQVMLIMSRKLTISCSCRR